VELSPLNDPSFLKIVAIHEAGHAVAAVVVELPLTVVRLRLLELPTGDMQFGHVESLIRRDDIEGKGEDAAMPHLVQYYAGPIAQRKVDFANTYIDGCESDKETIRRITYLALWSPSGWERKVDESRQRALMDRAYRKALSIVETRWTAINEVAELLLKREELGSDDVVEIVNRDRARKDQLRKQRP
jgi:hypothetical protein